MYNEKTRRRQERRQKQARIIKEQTEEKTRAEIFACRRCSVKYSSNTQLHKHIDEHHIKKLKNIKIEISTSNSTSNITSLSISVTQDHKTSTSSSSPSKKSLNISSFAVILNQASIIQVSITSIITSIISPQIT